MPLPKKEDLSTHKGVAAAAYGFNDNISLNNIIRNHNISDVAPSIIKSTCNLCTQDPPNFFMIDIGIILIRI